MPTIEELQEENKILKDEIALEIKRRLQMASKVTRLERKIQELKVERMK